MNLLRIDNLKINAYGNIKNKDISLNKGINIIHGANESGKSTLLSYIVNSFYGISKQKMEEKCRTTKNTNLGKVVNSLEE